MTILAAVLVVAFVAAAVRCGLHRTRPGVRPVVAGYVPRHAHTPASCIPGDHT